MGLLENIVTDAIWGNKNTKIPQWVEWHHETKGKTHCQTCLKLDKCWFVEDNKPNIPQHFFCHCKTNLLSIADVLNSVNAISRYSKYDPFLFDPDNFYKNGKRKLFESWGYTIKDAKWLQQEIEKQAKEKYILGEYTLGKIDENGQRINARITITNKNKGNNVEFISAWMVKPNGQISLITPYGGK